MGGTTLGVYAPLRRIQVQPRDGLTDTPGDTRADLFDAFRKAKAVQEASLNRDTLQLASETLDHILSEEKTQDCLAFAITFAEEHANGKTKANGNEDGDGNGKTAGLYAKKYVLYCRNKNSFLYTSIAVLMPVLQTLLEGSA